MERLKKLNFPTTSHNSQLPYAPQHQKFFESRETSTTRLRWRRHCRDGNSDDLQGARDFLVNDDYQFDFDDFLGPRPSGSTNSDAAQQDSRTGFTQPDSPRLWSPGGTPVTDADRLITELDRDRAVKLGLFHVMCAAFDQAAAGYAAGPGHILAQEFKQYYLRFWTAALKGESPSPLPRGAAFKAAAKTTTYASPEGPTTYTLKTQESARIETSHTAGKSPAG
ncbi:hypothetical protein E4U32_003958 [Claviceps aff. humidiphila group G2b]|nr:hypothetical protein E4U32_003958 [Claviceps aff. humidiphila group G2b]